MEDNYKHKGMRKQLIGLLREKGIEDDAVLKAMESIPRHYFMDNAFLNFAYEDQAFPIGEGQTISQPYTVAFQTSLLKVKKGEKILEIGTGSGYQTAVLCKLGAKVYTIERQRKLHDKARVILPDLGFRPRFFYGDGYKGLPAFAPFDKVLVTAGAPYIPEPLKEQLNPGGLIVIPVGENDTQQMLYLQKQDDGTFTTDNFGEFRFVPLLQDKKQ